MDLKKTLLGAVLSGTVLAGVGPTQASQTVTGTEFFSQQATSRLSPEYAMLGGMYHHLRNIAIQYASVYDPMSGFVIDTMRARELSGFSLQIHSSMQINASIHFSTKIVYINRGLFEKYKNSPDVIAAVIAHEFAHYLLPDERNEARIDQLGVHLATLAGYDPTASCRLQKDIFAQHGRETSWNRITCK